MLDGKIPVPYGRELHIPPTNYHLLAAQQEPYQDPSTLTLVGEHFKDDKSSFEVTVFKGPAEPVGALLEGAAEPLDAIFWGLAEPLEAILGGSAEPLSISEEHLVDSHGTWALADTVLDFPAEA